MRASKVRKGAGRWSLNLLRDAQRLSRAEADGGLDLLAQRLRRVLDQDVQVVVLVDAEDLGGLVDANGIGFAEVVVDDDFHGSLPEGCAGEAYHGLRVSCRWFARVKTGMDQHAVDDKEARIVATAVALAEEGGFEAVRLRDVAEHAGVALGTVYRHFRSKDDLLVAALSREAAGLAARMARTPPVGPTPLERVTLYFAAATRTLCRKPKLARAVLRAASSDEPELAGKIRAFHGVAGDLLIRALRADSSASLDAATEHEQRVCAVLQQVWFAALIGWMSGLHKQSEVVAQVRSAAQLLLE